MYIKKTSTAQFVIPRSVKLDDLFSILNETYVQKLNQLCCSVMLFSGEKRFFKMKTKKLTAESAPESSLHRNNSPNTHNLTT